MESHKIPMFQTTNQYYNLPIDQFRGGDLFIHQPGMEGTSPLRRGNPVIWTRQE
jgi:hypothetical protein